jgi:hypothetical protein
MPVDVPHVPTMKSFPTAPVSVIKDYQALHIMSIKSGIIGGGLLAMILYSCLTPTLALDLAPRQWSHLPTDINLTAMAYVKTDADITIDPVLRLEDVEMELDTWAFRHIHTFELLGKSARVDITQAYQEGVWTGLLDGSPASTSRHGLSDTFVRFSVNLYGAPPMKGKEYGAYRNRVGPETVVGAGLAVRLPTGDYMEDKLINLGNNRFTLRPQIGVQHTSGKWSAELTAEIAFHTDNDEFFNGNKLEQDPLFITHGNITHTFSPGHWAGLSFGFDRGGESTINGVAKEDRKKDTGYALHYVLPINRQAGVSISYIKTRTHEDVGMDTDSLSAAVSLLW